MGILLRTLLWFQAIDAFIVHPVTRYRSPSVIWSSRPSLRSSSRRDSQSDADALHEKIEAARSAVLKNDYDWYVENVATLESSIEGTPPESAMSTGDDPSMEVESTTLEIPTSQGSAVDGPLVDDDGLDSHAALMDLGYSEAEVHSLLPDAVGMILELGFRRPTSVTLPEEWLKLANVDEAALPSSSIRTPPPEYGGIDGLGFRGLDDDFDLGDVDDVGFLDNPWSENNQPSRRREIRGGGRRGRDNNERYGDEDYEGEDEGDDDEDLLLNYEGGGGRRQRLDDLSPAWPSLTKFKDMLRDESELRLDIFPWMLEGLRTENRVRINLYKWWLGGVRNGFGEDLAEEQQLDLALTADEWELIDADLEEAQARKAERTKLEERAEARERLQERQQQELQERQQQRQRWRRQGSSSSRSREGEDGYFERRPPVVSSAQATRRRRSSRKSESTNSFSARPGSTTARGSRDYDYKRNRDSSNSRGGSAFDGDSYDGREGARSARSNSPDHQLRRRRRMTEASVRAREEEKRCW